MQRIMWFAVVLVLTAVGDSQVRAAQEPDPTTTPESTASSGDEERAELGPFRIAIGTTFDFIDGVRASEVYSDVDINLPELWSVFGGKLGLRAGFTNGREVTQSDSMTRTIQLELAHPDPDSAYQASRETTQIVSSRRDRLGLYMMPVLHAGSHVNFGLRFEITIFESENRSQLRFVRADTIGAIANTVMPPRRLRDTPFETSDSIVRIYRNREFETLFALSVGFNINVNRVALFIEPAVGGGLRHSEGTVHFAIPFSITDEQSGIKLGGDLRGPFGEEEPTLLIYLGKVFDMSGLARFLTGTGTG